MANERLWRADISNNILVMILIWVHVGKFVLWSLRRHNLKITAFPYHKRCCPVTNLILCHLKSIIVQHIGSATTAGFIHIKCQLSVIIYQKCAEIDFFVRLFRRIGLQCAVVAGDSVKADPSFVSLSTNRKPISINRGTCPDSHSNIIPFIRHVVWGVSVFL